MQLEANGVQVGDQVATGSVPAQAAPLIAFRGRTLGEIVRLFLKYSNNEIGEGLVKALAARTGTGGAGWRAGRRRGARRAGARRSRHPEHHAGGRLGTLLREPGVTARAGRGAADRHRLVPVRPGAARRASDRGGGRHAREARRGSGEPGAGEDRTAHARDRSLGPGAARGRARGDLRGAGQRLPRRRRGGDARARPLRRRARRRLPSEGRPQGRLPRRPRSEPQASGGGGAGYAGAVSARQQAERAASRRRAERGRRRLCRRRTRKARNGCGARRRLPGPGSGTGPASRCPGAGGGRCGRGPSCRRPARSRGCRSGPRARADRRRRAGC